MKVLLISGARLRSHDLVRAFDPLLGDGFQLSLVTWGPPTQSLLDVLSGAVVHGPRAVLPDPEDEAADLDASDGPGAGAPPTAGVRAPIPYDRARIRAGIIRRFLGATDRLPPQIGRYVPAARRLHGQRHRIKQLWKASRRHPGVDALAAAADMIVAVDIEALRTTWWLGRRYRKPELVLGVGSATALLLDRRLGPPVDGVAGESLAD